MQNLIIVYFDTAALYGSIIYAIPLFCHVHFILLLKRGAEM